MFKDLTEIDTGAGLMINGEGEFNAAELDYLKRDRNTGRLDR